MKTPNFVYEESQAKKDFSEKFDNLLTLPSKSSLLEIPVVIDVTVPLDEIWVQRYGVTVGRIVNLGVNYA